MAIMSEENFVTKVLNCNGMDVVTTNLSHFFIQICPATHRVWLWAGYIWWWLWNDSPPSSMSSRTHQSSWNSQNLFVLEVWIITWALWCWRQHTFSSWVCWRQCWCRWAAHRLRSECNGHKQPKWDPSAYCCSQQTCKSGWGPTQHEGLHRVSNSGRSYSTPLCSQRKWYWDD